MPIPTITLLPTAPTTADPLSFRARGDAFLGGLNTFNTELNDAIDGINTALPILDLAVSNTNFQGEWNSGTAYTVGQSVAHNTVGYIALVNNTNKIPSGNPTEWSSISVARKEGASGAVYIGAYTTATRPTLGVNDRVVGYNSTLSSFEGWNGTSWGSLGGGATGGNTDKVFQENDMVVTTDYTLTAGKSASSVGGTAGITINSGVSVTVPNGASWVIL
jgi:hypothetical protein